MGTLAFSIAFGHFERKTQGGPLTFLMVPNDSGEEIASGASKSVPENSGGGRHAHRIEGPPEYKDRPLRPHGMLLTYQCTRTAGLLFGGGVY